jgi:hypothetical protein
MKAQTGLKAGGGYNSCYSPCHREQEAELSVNVKVDIGISLCL